jgi:hypothetical protein
MPRWRDQNGSLLLLVPGFGTRGSARGLVPAPTWPTVNDLPAARFVPGLAKRALPVSVHFNSRAANRSRVMAGRLRGAS